MCGLSLYLEPENKGMTAFFWKRKGIGTFFYSGVCLKKVKISQVPYPRAILAFSRESWFPMSKIVPSIL